MFSVPLMYNYNAISEDNYNNYHKNTKNNPYPQFTNVQ